MLLGACTLMLLTAVFCFLGGVHFLTEGGRPYLGAWILGAAVSAFAFAALLKGVNRIAEAVEDEGES